MPSSGMIVILSDGMRAGRQAVRQLACFPRQLAAAAAVADVLGDSQCSAMIFLACPAVTRLPLSQITYGVLRLSTAQARSATGQDLCAGYSAYLPDTDVPLQKVTAWARRHAPYPPCARGASGRGGAGSGCQNWAHALSAWRPRHVAVAFIKSCVTRLIRDLTQSRW